MQPTLNHSTDDLDFNAIHTNYFDLIHDFVFILDTEAKIINVNKAVIDRLGFSMEDILNKSVLVVHPPERHDEAAEIVEEMLRGETESCKIPLLTKDGRLIPVETRITQGKIQNKDILVGISRDITEWKDAELRLKESETKYRGIIETMREGYFEVDLKGNLTYFNDLVCEFLGYSREELIGMNFRNFIKTEDANEVLKKFNKVYSDEIFHIIFESEIITKDEMTKILELSAYLKRNPDGKKVGFYCLARDITENKEAEQKLKESEENYRLITTSINDLIIVLNDKMKIEYVNESICQKLVGYTKNEVIGKNTLKYAHPDDIDRIVNALKKGFQEGEGTIIARIKHRDGYYLWVEVKGTIFYDNSNNMKVLFIARDITERKKSEEALINEKLFTETALNTQRDTFFVFDPSIGKPIRWNKAFNEVTGYSDEEISKLEAPASYYNEEDLKQLSGAITLIEQGKTSVSEANLITKNGRVVPFEYVASGIFDDDKNLKYIVAVGRNITERKKTEQKVEDIARFPSENPNPVLRANVNEILYTNQTGKSLFNIQEGSKIPEVLREYIGESITSNTGQDIELLLDNHFYSFAITPVKETGYANIYGKDISKRKQSEKKLEESEEKFRNLFKQSTNAIALLDLTGKIVECNLATEKILGYSIEELIGQNYLELPFYSESVINRLKERFQEITKGISVKPQELEIKRKDGNIATVKASISFIKIGEQDFFQAIIQDITEQKNAEQKLMESEEKYRNLFNTTPFGLALFNFEGILMDINDSLTQITGFSREELIGKHYKVLSIYPTPEKTDFYKREEELSKGQLPKPRELSISRKDGSLIWIYSKLSFVQFGEKRYLQATINDITQSKLSEQLLKESEENYRAAFDRANFYKELFAHDMNNVLNSILLSTELISETPKKQEKMESLIEMFTIIKESTIRGAKLIKNVQKLSKLEETDFNIQNINVITFLKDAISFIKNNYPDKNIEIKMKPLLEEIYICANELLLDVFENLLINAVKYNNNQEIEILIKTSEIKADGKMLLKLEFIDNGMGIEHYRKEKIFKVGNREYKGGRGMGIGLSLVKNIVESYGGKIMVEDKVYGDYSKGSNFIVLIPKNN